VADFDTPFLNRSGLKLSPQDANLHTTWTGAQIKDKLPEAMAECTRPQKLDPGQRNVHYTSE